MSKPKDPQISSKNFYNLLNLKTAILKLILGDIKRHVTVTRCYPRKAYVILYY